MDGLGGVGNHTQPWENTDLNKERITAIIFACTTLALTGALAFVLVVGRTEEAAVRPQAQPNPGETGAAPGPDTRTTVLLTASERDLVLAEMRMLLVSVASVARDVEQKQFERAAKTARAAGLDTALRIGGEHPAILRKLPLPMKRLGFSVHRDFDALALRLEKKDIGQGELLRTLATTLDKCSACHGSYRIAVEK